MVSRNHSPGFMIWLLACLISPWSLLHAGDNSPVAYKIGGQPITVNQARTQDLGAFYNLEKKLFDLVSHRAQLDYLEYFWKQQAKASGKSVGDAQLAFEAQNIKVTDADVQNALPQFAGQPSFAKLSDAERKSQIHDYLYENARQNLMVALIERAVRSGELLLTYPEPIEPIYEVKVTKNDFVRYGPETTDTKPVACKGDSCPITIVEYSDFQCGFCARAVPDVKRLLAEYKGRIRWISRDFPIKFHDRSKPSAIAAHCAGEQGKYWEMYTQLFSHQRQLDDEDLKAHAVQVGLSLPKFEACINAPRKVLAQIEANTSTGTQLGVVGTPAYFVNGRRAAGAMPYDDFKKFIENK